MGRWLRRILLGLAGLVGVLIVAVVGLRATGQLRVYTTPSAGMIPTLNCGDHFAVVPYWSGGPSRGDVIVFKRPSPFGGSGSVLVVKRVVGVEGDEIEAREDLVYVNGRPFDHHPTSLGLDSSHTVRSDAYFVLGDNREVSDDSRDFGDVPRSSVIGRVIGVYWPLGDAGSIAESAASEGGATTSC